MTTRMTRRMTWARPAAVTGGLYVSLLASVIHRHTSEVGSLTVPWGMLLAIATTYLAVQGVDAAIRGTAPWFAIGWAVGLLVPMLFPGESFLIAEDAVSISYLLGGVGALAVATVRASRLDR